MKRTPFKVKYSPLKRSSLKRSTKRMRSFREIKGEKEVWQVPEADSKFSKDIRQRDQICLNCGSTRFLTCSHYHKRQIWNTRFDPENCITLCVECHNSWENQKDGIYKDFMFSWLGEERFYKLEERSKIKITPYEAIREYMESRRLKKVEVGDIINY